MTLIEEWSDEYLASNSVYANHINKFVAYIKRIGKSDKPTKISLNDVEECIGYYNELGQINSFGSMAQHLSSVQSFYKFLVSKSWAENIFAEIYDHQGYKEKIAKKYNLAELQEREYLSGEIIKQVLDTLDTYFENNEYSNLKGQKRTRFIHYTILRIYIKISLIAPAKRAVLADLSSENFSNDYRIIKINDVEIHVPNALRRDLKEAVRRTQEIVGKPLNEKENIYVYLNMGKFSKPELNAWFCTFLKEFEILDIPEGKYSYSLEVLRNSVVVELIENGVDLALIAKISGVRTDALERRYFKVKAYDNDKLSDLINQGISRNSYYSYI